MPTQYVTTELVNSIQRIAEQTGRDLRLEEAGVIVALLDQYGNLPWIRDYLSYFGAGDLVATVRNVWHRRFEQGLKLIFEPKSQTRVLCAFGSIVDLVHTLDHTALLCLENWCLNSPLNRKLLHSPDPENSVNIPEDVIAALAKAFQSEGLKPTVEKCELRGELRNKFPLRSHQRSLGGAPAIIAEALTQLGVDARVYSMYHSITQAHRFEPRLDTKWLDLCAGQPVYRQAHGAGQRGHPTRNTIVLAYSQGLALKSNSKPAQNTDRLLLVMRPYVGARPLTSCFVRRMKHKPISIAPDCPPEWPSVAGFVTWRLGGASRSQLQINFMSSEVVTRLARDHHYVVLNAPGLGQLQQPNDLTKALLEQIQILSDAGATIHMEISGGADSEKHKFAPFAQSLRGWVRSMGINHKELAQVASLRDFPSQAIAPIVGSHTLEVYHRFVQAACFADALKLERLYVHGNDVDLILRRGTSEAALQQEVHADLFTKGAAIVSILLRNGLDPQTYSLPRALYHEGFRALVELAWQFSREKSGLGLTKRKALFRRIVNDGHYLAAGRDEYSFAAVPVMWPEAVRLDPGINVTGAGDICSGFSLIYSGWR